MVSINIYMEVFMKYNSLKMTSLIITIFMVVSICSLIFAYPISLWFCDFSHSVDAEGKVFYFTITLLLGFIPAFTSLVCLKKLVKAIENDDTFTLKNIKLLNIISKCCSVACLLCFVSAIYYIVWCFVGVAAGFMALLIRVIKDTFIRAYEIKTENDLTI